MAMSSIHIPRDMHVQQQLLLSPRKSLLPSFRKSPQEQSTERPSKQPSEGLQARRRSEEDSAQVDILPTIPERRATETFVTVKLQHTYRPDQDGFGIIAESFTSIKVTGSTTYQQMKGVLCCRAVNMVFDDSATPASILGFPMLKTANNTKYIEQKHWETARELLFFKGMSLVFQFEVRKEAGGSSAAQTTEPKKKIKAGLKSLAAKVQRSFSKQKKIKAQKQDDREATESRKAVIKEERHFTGKGMSPSMNVEVYGLEESHFT